MPLDWSIEANKVSIKEIYSVEIHGKTQTGRSATIRFSGVATYDPFVELHAGEEIAVSQGDSVYVSIRTPSEKSATIKFAYEEIDYLYGYREGDD